MLQLGLLVGRDKGAVGHKQLGGREPLVLGVFVG